MGLVTVAFIVLTGRLAARTPDDIELAERLWQMRKTPCGPALGDSDEALALVMGKLAQ